MRLRHSKRWERHAQEKAKNLQKGTRGLSYAGNKSAVINIISSGRFVYPERSQERELTRTDLDVEVEKGTRAVSESEYSVDPPAEPNISPKATKGKGGKYSGQTSIYWILTNLITVSKAQATAAVHSYGYDDDEPTDKGMGSYSVKEKSTKTTMGKYYVYICILYVQLQRANLSNVTLLQLQSLAELVQNQLHATPSPTRRAPTFMKRLTTGTGPKLMPLNRGHIGGLDLGHTNMDATNM